MKKPKGPTDLTTTPTGNMKAAAARLGITVAEVKIAKALGCCAFRPNNTIRIEELEEFIKTPEFRDAAKSAADGADWDKRLKRAKALREELRLSRERGELWDSGLTVRAYTAGDEAMVSTLRRWLESDLPPLIEGKGAGEILAQNRKFMDELVGELRAARDKAVAEIKASIREASAEEEEAA
jgi:hypothetical protein